MSESNQPAADELIAQAIEDERLPSVDELKLLLERYFEAPVTDDDAARLHVAMSAMVQDRPRLLGECSAFREVWPTGPGYAWHEEFSYGRRHPRTVDLAMFHAATMRGWPKPKLHCPDFFVGTWRQLGAQSSEPILWTLAANGDFQTTHGHFSEYIRWCLERSTMHPETYLYSKLRLSKRVGSRHGLIIERGSDNSLRLGELRIDGEHTCELERCDEAAGVTRGRWTGMAPIILAPSESTSDQPATGAAAAHGCAPPTENAGAETPLFVTADEIRALGFRWPPPMTRVVAEIIERAGERIDLRVTAAGLASAHAFWRKQHSEIRQAMREGKWPGAESVDELTDAGPFAEDCWSAAHLIEDIISKLEASRNA